MHFEDEDGKAEDDDIDVRKEVFFFYQKFQCLNFYYSMVNQKHGGGLAPSFYRFQICPIVGPQINRVFEVEEFMGKCFIEEVASMHIAHQQLIQHAKRAKKMDFKSSQLALDDQQSLPAFILGRQVALLCKKLEAVTVSDQSQLEGAGELYYSKTQGSLQCSVRNIKSYFDSDRDRYCAMMDTIKDRWTKYTEKIEREVIESKFDKVIDSFTFKYTRQPAMLSLIPDQIKEHNLRMNSTIKIHNQQDEKQGSKDSKFYKDVYNDPDRSNNLSDILDSVMYEIQRSDIHGDKGQKRFTITKDVCIAGASPAKRSKYQLIASMMFLIDFHLRKVNRRTELFVHLDSNASKDDVIIAESEYDGILDSILAGMQQNYGNDEINHVLDMIELKRGGQDTLFDYVLREKMQRQIKARERHEQLEEMRKRKKRNDMNVLILELLQQENNLSLKRDQSEIRELKQFLDQKNSKGFSAYDGDKFAELLHTTKLRLASNSMKMAEEFVLKTQIDVEKKIEGVSTI